MSSEEELLSSIADGLRTSVNRKYEWGAIQSQQASPAEGVAAFKQERETGFQLPLTMQSQDKLTASPITAEFLYYRPDSGSAYKPDVGQMSAFERVWANTKQKTAEPFEVSERGRLGMKYFSGAWNPADEAKYIEVERRGRMKPDYDLSIFNSGNVGELLMAVPGAAAYTGAQILDLAASTDPKYAYYGAVAGAAAGMLGGPAAAATVPGGAITGMFAGLAFGGMWELNLGNTVLDYRAYRDESHMPLDQDTTRGAALLASIPIAGLDAFGLTKIAQASGVSRLTSDIFKTKINDALKIPSVRAALARLGKKVGVASMTEGTTEIAQELIAVATGVLSGARMEDGAPITVAGSLEKAGRQGEQGFLGAGSFAGAAAAPSTYVDIRAAQDAGARQVVMEAISANNKDMKLHSTVPEAAKQWVDEVARKHPDGVQEMLVAKDAIEQFLQQTELTSEQKATAFPGLMANLESSSTDGSDFIAVPIAEFSTYIAPSALFSSIVKPNMKLTPKEWTERETVEIKDTYKELEELLAKSTPSNKFPEWAQPLVDQMAASGIFDSETLTAQVLPLVHIIETRAKRMNMTAEALAAIHPFTFASTAMLDALPGQSLASQEGFRPSLEQVGNSLQWLVDQLGSDAFMIKNLVSSRELPTIIKSLGEGFSIVPVGKTETTQSWEVTTPAGIAPIYMEGGHVSVDFSNLTSGKSSGFMLYQAVAAWAAENNWIFEGDPKGITNFGLVRRTEAMISAALRKGTTKYLMPHPYQVQMGEERDPLWTIKQFQWKAENTAFNLGAMAEASYLNLREIFPEIERYSLNDKGQIVQPSGRVLTEKGMETLVDQLAIRWDAFDPEELAEKKDGKRQSPFGKTTITRAVYTQAILRGEDIPVEGYRNKLYSTGVPDREKSGGYVYIGGKTQVGFQIHMTRHVDMAVFMHEVGHTLLQMMRIDLRDGRATAEMAVDMQKVNNWLTTPANAKLALQGGSKKYRVEATPENIARYIEVVNAAYDNPIWPTDELDIQLWRQAHEFFARGMEAYLRRGIAPSEELRTTFQRFKDWLQRIYTLLRNLHVRLSPDIVGVFDRSMATDEAIARAATTTRFSPTFDADVAGEFMTPEQFAAYNLAFEKAYEKGEADTRAELNDLAERELQAQYRAKWTELLEEKVLAYDTTIEAIAAYWMKHGKVRPNVQAAIDAGLEIPGIQGNLDEIFAELSAVGSHKVDRAEMLKLYAKDKAAQAKLLAITEKDGIPADEMAMVFGYPSGAEMLEMIATMPGRNDWINNTAKAELDAIYPDPVGAAMTIAVEKIHGNEQIEFLVNELRMMDQKLSRKTTPLGILRGIAKEYIDQLPVYQLRIKDFQSAQSKFAKASLEALRKKDYSAARTAKMMQVLNHLMEKATIEARKKSVESQHYLRRFKEPKHRARIGKAGPQYLNAIDMLLQELSFATTTNNLIERREKLRTYIDQIVAEGKDEHDIVVALKQLAPLQIANWRSLTVKNLRDITDGVKEIENIARFKIRLKNRAEKRKIDSAAEAISIRTRETNPVRAARKIPGTESAMDRAWAKASSMIATLEKVEFITLIMDGGKPGPAHVNIFQPLADAQAYESKLLKEEGDAVISPLVDYIKKAGPRLDEKVKIGNEWHNIKTLIAMAFNMGNAQNFKALGDGYAHRGWSPAFLFGIAEEHLTFEEWTMIQQVWDGMNTRIFPLVSAVYERRSGLPLDAVVADAFQIRDSEGKLHVMSGGYYPLAFDFTGLTEADIAKLYDHTDDLFTAEFYGPHLTDTFVKQRTEAVFPLRLDLSVLSNHVRHALHYVAFYDAVHRVNKLVHRHNVQAAVSNTLGEASFKQFMPWLKALASNGEQYTESAQLLDWFAKHLRFGTNLAVFGLTVGSALMQALGVFTTADAIGLKHTLLGFSKLQGKDFQLMAGVAADKSYEIRHIMDNFNREMLDHFKYLERTHGHKWASHVMDKAVYGAYFMMGYMQKMVSTAAWYGAYEKAIAENPTDELTAVRYADSVVRTTQGSGAMKDLAYVARGGDVQRLFTMFYTYFSVLYNRLWMHTRQRRFKDPKYLMENATAAMWLLIAPTLVEGLMKGRTPDEDSDESLLGWLMMETMVYAFAGIPLVRDIFNMAVQDRPYATSPIETTLKRMGGALKDVNAWAAGEEVDREALVRDWAASASVVLRLPVSGIARFYEAFDAFNTGEVTEAEAIHQAIFGVQRESK